MAFRKIWVLSVTTKTTMIVPTALVTFCFLIVTLTADTPESVELQVEFALDLVRHFGYRYLDLRADCQDDEWEVFLSHLIANMSQQQLFVRAACNQVQENFVHQQLMGKVVVFVLDMKNKAKPSPDSLTVHSKMRKQVEIYIPEQEEVSHDESFKRHLQLDSRVFTYRLDVRKKHMHIKEIYAIKGIKVVTNSIGEWNLQSGCSIPEPQIWRRRRDFLEVPLEATYLYREQYAILEDSMFISAVLTEIHVSAKKTINVIYVLQHQSTRVVSQ